MQQTRTQSLVSRKMKSARECGARRGRAKDYGESYFGLTIPCATKRLGTSLGVQWAWDRAEKKGGKRIASANCMK